MSNKKSPCIDLCVFDSDTKWCVACGRTLEEARQWYKLKPYAKTKILKDLPKRIQKLKVLEKFRTE